METTEAIFKRRSVRKYKTEKISEEIIDELIRLAMQSPSARGLFPCHYIIIDDRKILNRIPDFHPYSKMLLDAPVAILVCGDKNLQELEGYIALDCAAATQNILLAATDMGLGSVWLGIYPREERMSGIINLFNLPENIMPVSLIAIGYADEEKSIVDRFNSTRVHKNKW